MLRRPKDLAAVPGRLPGFDCKRRPMRPLATGNFLKWPMAWKRLDSTAVVIAVRLFVTSSSHLSSPGSKWLRLTLSRLTLDLHASWHVALDREAWQNLLAWLYSFEFFNADGNVRAVKSNPHISEMRLTLLVLRAARSSSRRNLEPKRAENLQLRFASSAHIL